MRAYSRSLLGTISLILLLAFNLVWTFPVYADGDVPPVDPPPTTEPPAQSEAADPTPAADSGAAVPADIPPDTEIIVLDDLGGTIPLVANEAASALLQGDPQWCPSGVTPGSLTCTPSRTSFSDTLNDLAALNGGLGPNMAGTIWIHKDYDSSTATGIVTDVGVTSFTLNGSLLANMRNFALTIQGGWTGTAKTIDTADPSQFSGASLNVTGWLNGVTLSDITITANMTGTSSLHVITTGNITAARVNVNSNSGGGAFLDNDEPGGTGNVTITAGQFNNNTNTSPGLRVDSLGSITLKEVTANGNGSGASGHGIQLTNDNAPTAKAITLTNSTASNNRNYGISIQSIGSFTGTDLTAVSNGLGGVGSGLYLNNAGGTAGATLNGTNLFFSNADHGLDISSRGAVKLNNINAVDNGGIGAQVENNTGVTPQPITFTGTNTFKFNAVAGLWVISLGQITANNLIVNSNLGIVGAYLVNNSGSGTNGVTLTGASTFSYNDTSGLSIQSAGAVTLANITANGNGFGSSGNGVFIANVDGSLFKGVTLTGTNTFNGNNGDGLGIYSEGVVTLSNLNANNNLGGAGGVIVDNTPSTPASPKAVIITGTNIFNDNTTYGLSIKTHGAITTNNLTATSNGASFGYGAWLDNYTSTTTPANITLTGANSFNGNYSGGLSASSLGLIKASTVTANDNTNGGGATFSNQVGASTGGITLTGTNTFTGNSQDNLTVSSNGMISLSNITASNSDAANGAVVNNSTAATSKSVTLSGTNNFSDNWLNGLQITSDGAITTSNLNASGNGVSGALGYGANFNNLTAPTPAGVTLTGTNTFNNNRGTGLEIDTLGQIKANNLTAGGSTIGYGANFDNDGAGSIGGVTLSGTNKFIGNFLSNLDVSSIGVITINNLTASSSLTGYGALLQNTASTSATPKTVTLSGTNLFSGNSDGGLYVYTYGGITTNGLTATGNGSGSSENGVLLDNGSGVTPANVTLNGSNVFTGNTLMNLQVLSLGNIKANNVTASGSLSHYGAVFNNDFAGATGGVTLTGTNTFNDNSAGSANGLSVYSRGAIAISNVTANNNGGRGVQLDNTSSSPATPKSVTLTGFIQAKDNGAIGLYIVTHGAVTTNNLTTLNNVGYGTTIDNSTGTSAPAAVTLNGTNLSTGNSNYGIFIRSLGNVLANNLNASNNVNAGAYINGNFGGAIGTVTLKGTNIFDGNIGVGLEVDAINTVTLNNITATNSAGSDGAYINNSYGAPKPVTLTGTSVFNDNGGGLGLEIISHGAITLNNLTANGNGSMGASLTNTGAAAVNVTLTGTNHFEGNTLTGLSVISLGNISVSNLTAKDNVQSGASLNNSAGASTTTVNVTGVNSFTGNGQQGLLIAANGTVSLTKVTADENNQGVYVTTNGNINYTCGSVINNTLHGWYLFTTGITTVKGVVAAGNTPNTFYNVGGTLVQSIGCPLP